MLMGILHAAFARRSFRDPAARSTGLLPLLLCWTERARQRHALAALDAQQRRDVGLEADTIAREIRKPFWLS
ncbi:MAG: DUF1127 domain-containing protein [Alphaproteobacteria bacterium]|nr:DUF1127 domain-containing protein [Alphaproteobacteria bacterium]